MSAIRSPVQTQHSQLQRTPDQRVNSSAEHAAVGGEREQHAQSELPGDDLCGAEQQHRHPLHTADHRRRKTNVETEPRQPGTGVDRLHIARPPSVLALRLGTQQLDGAVPLNVLE